MNDPLKKQRQQQLLSLAVGGLEALFSLTSGPFCAFRVLAHWNTKQEGSSWRSWLDDQCTNLQLWLQPQLASVENIKLLVMHDIIMEFWEKYELIVVKKRPRSEKIFFHNISRLPQHCFAMDLCSIACPHFRRTVLLTIPVVCQFNLLLNTNHT